MASTRALQRPRRRCFWTCSCSCRGPSCPCLRRRLASGGGQPRMAASAGHVPRTWLVASWACARAQTPARAGPAASRAYPPTYPSCCRHRPASRDPSGNFPELQPRHSSDRSLTADRLTAHGRYRLLVRASPCPCWARVPPASAPFPSGSCAQRCPCPPCPWMPPYVGPAAAPAVARACRACRACSGPLMGCARSLRPETHTDTHPHTQFAPPQNQAPSTTDDAMQVALRWREHSRPIASKASTQRMDLQDTQRLMPLARPSRGT